MTVQIELLNNEGINTKKQVNTTDIINILSEYVDLLKNKKFPSVELENLKIDAEGTLTLKDTKRAKSFKKSLERLKNLVFYLATGHNLDEPQFSFDIPVIRSLNKDIPTEFGNFLDKLLQGDIASQKSFQDHFMRVTPVITASMKPTEVDKEINPEETTENLALINEKLRGIGLEIVKEETLIENLKITNPVFTFSPDGLWAVFFDSEKNKLEFVDMRKREVVEPPFPIEELGNVISLSWSIRNIIAVLVKDKNKTNLKIIFLALNKVETIPIPTHIDAWSYTNGQSVFLKTNKVSWDHDGEKIWILNEGDNNLINFKIDYSSKNLNYSDSIKNLQANDFSISKSNLVAFSKTDGGLYLKLGGRNVFSTSIEGYNLCPCWSPCERWIIFTSSRGLNNKIYIKDVNNVNNYSKEICITPLRDHCFWPVWSSDGKHIVFAEKVGGDNYKLILLKLKVEEKVEEEIQTQND